MPEEEGLESGLGLPHPYSSSQCGLNALFQSPWGILEAMTHIIPLHR